MIDLRRRPKRSASDATPRILPLFLRGLLVVGLEAESAVAGRGSEARRVGLGVKGLMSSSARELAEIIRRKSGPVEGRGVAITRGAGRARTHQRTQTRAGQNRQAPFPWSSISH